MKNLNFSRQILPIIAIVGIILTAILIFAYLPDRSLSDPASEPPRSPSAQSETGSVSGTGIVEPSSEEIAERMDIPVSKVRKVLKIAQEPISLETPIGEEEDDLSFGICT